MGNDRAFCTKKQVSQYLKISSSTLDKLVKAGRIKSTAIGRQIRFDLDNLFEAKNEATQQPAK